MSVRAIPHCVYGYKVPVEEFRNMISYYEYDSLFDWLDDYNRYEWCFYDELFDYIYFGIPIGYNSQITTISADWTMFIIDVLDIHVKLKYLSEDIKKEGPHFYVFTIWD